MRGLMRLISEREALSSPLVDRALRFALAPRHRPLQAWLSPLQKPPQADLLMRSLRPLRQSLLAKPQRAPAGKSREAGGMGRAAGAGMRDMGRKGQGEDLGGP